MRCIAHCLLLAGYALQHASAAEAEVNMFDGSYFLVDADADQQNTFMLRLDAATLGAQKPELQDNLPATINIAFQSDAAAISLPASAEASLVDKPEGQDGKAYEFELPVTFPENGGEALVCGVRVQFKAVISDEEISIDGWPALYVNWRYPSSMLPPREDIALNEALLSIEDGGDQGGYPQELRAVQEFCYRPNGIRLIVQGAGEAEAYCKQVYQVFGRVSQSLQYHRFEETGREELHPEAEDGQQVVDVEVPEGESGELHFKCVKSNDGKERHVRIAWWNGA